MLLPISSTNITGCIQGRSLDQFKITLLVKCVRTCKGEGDVAKTRSVPERFNISLYGLHIVCLTSSFRDKLGSTVTVWYSRRVYSFITITVVPTNIAIRKAKLRGFLLLFCILHRWQINSYKGASPVSISCSNLKRLLSFHREFPWCSWNILTRGLHRMIWLTCQFLNITCRGIEPICKIPHLYASNSPPNYQLVVLSIKIYLHFYEHPITWITRFIECYLLELPAIVS